MPESTRAYLYRVAVAVVPLLVVLGYAVKHTSTS